MRTTNGSAVWSISRTSPSSMMLRLISGSITCSKAVLISSSVAISSSPVAGLEPWLIREPDEKLVSFHAHRIGLDRRDRGKGERGSCLDIESRAVTGADHLVLLDLSLGERPAVVRADVLDGVEAIPEPEDGDLPVLDVEDLRAPSGYVTRLSHAHVARRPGHP